MNSVRHAHWHSTLGVQRRCGFLVNMSSLRSDGGLVPAMRVVVSRQYPVVYLHPPSADGAQTPSAGGPAAAAPGGAVIAPVKVRKLHCNQRAHDARMRTHERIMEKKLE